MPKQRSQRALNNDDAIREAAIGLILSTGLDAISFRDVGKAAGLSHGALYARFEDVEELLVDLWSEVLSVRVISLFAAVKNAVSKPSDESIAAVLDRVRDAEPADVAAVQVLLLSRRFPILREEVEIFIQGYLDSIPSDLSNAEWSRAMMLFSLVMTKIFSNSEFGLNRERLKFMQPVLTAALSMDPDAVPHFEYTEPEEWTDETFRTDLQSQLALSTYSAVGVSGYTKATISRISRRADCSPGAIYKLFPSKEELVIFAMRRMMVNRRLVPTRLASAFDEGLLAQTLFSSASSQNNLRKYFVMEMMLASAQNTKLRDAVGAQLQSLENIASMVTEISDEERTNLRFAFRELTLLTLGVTFLSTISQSTTKIDFA